MNKFSLPAFAHRWSAVSWLVTMRRFCCKGTNACQAQTRGSPRCRQVFQKSIRVKFASGREDVNKKFLTHALDIINQPPNAQKGVLKRYGHLLDLVLDEVEKQVQGISGVALLCSPPYSLLVVFSDPEPHTCTLVIAVNCQAMPLSTETVPTSVPVDLPFNAYGDQLTALSYGLCTVSQAPGLALTELASTKKDARRSAIHDRITDSWSPPVRLRARSSGREIARVMNEEQKVDLGSSSRLSLCVLIVVRSA